MGVVCSSGRYALRGLSACCWSISRSVRVTRYYHKGPLLLLLPFRIIISFQNLVKRKMLARIDILERQTLISLCG